MIVRIDEKILQFSSQIAQAKLEAHPKLRLVMSDGGVLGELRIRELRIIGVREGNKLILQNIPKNLHNTKVIVKESGREILCDPSKAYFSTKLQTERQETLFFAKKLHDLLGRKINVCDPFCGVGPALASLLSENNLVGNLLASDLNPDAIEILFENLTKWDKKSYNSLSNRPDLVNDISDLSDVDTQGTPPTPGQVLKWDGLRWAPANDATSGGGGLNADTLDGFDSPYFLDYSNLNNRPTLFDGNFSSIVGLPTTLSGYGITDSISANQSYTQNGTVTFNDNGGITVGTSNNVKLRIIFSFFLNYS